MPTLDLVRRRISVRTYEDREVGPDLRQALLDHAESLVTPFGNRARFAWVGVSRDAAGRPRSPGTYGMIQGARLYLAGAMTLGSGACEDFGYQFEGLVLKATELGLGTCWLGGTFDRAEFRDALAPAPGEAVAAVTPVGYASGRRHLQEVLATALIRVRLRRPLKDLVLSDAPLAAPAEGRGPLDEALEAVRLGPSASNKQPWRLFVGSDRRTVHFYLEETPGYNDTFESRHGFRIQNLDLGIALHHFERTLADQGIHGSWSRTDPGLAVPRSWLYRATWST